MSVVVLLMVVALLVVLAGVAAVALGATLVQRNAKRQLQVAPGVRSQAPANWVGSHSPEAALHRRVVAATARLRQAADQHPLLADSVAAVEADAVALDGELVAAAALDERADPAGKRRLLAQLEDAVVSVETMADRAIVVTRPTEEPTLRDALDARSIELDDRLEAIRQARLEVDRLERESGFGSPNPGD